MISRPSASASILGTYTPDTDSSASGGFRVVEELVWLDGFRPVLSVRPNASSGMSAPDYFTVLTDHLGTPRKVLDKNGATRWSWDAKEPFGNTLPQETHESFGAFKFNLRFPGQWFDQETGLYHNGFRDYHPGLGRYVQSDPLGLEAGWNTYGYVMGDPLRKEDPFGLQAKVSAGISAKLQAGIPQIGFIGGGTSIGLNIPTKWRDWRCYQVFIEFNANATGGVGIFAGVGFTGGISRSKGKMQPIETSTGAIVDGNIGLGLSAGTSALWEGRVYDLKKWVTPNLIEGVSAGGGNLGAGYGAAVTVGEYTSTTLATPTMQKDCTCL